MKKLDLSKPHNVSALLIGIGAVLNFLSILIGTISRITHNIPLTPLSTIFSIIPLLVMFWTCVKVYENSNGKDTITVFQWYLIIMPICISLSTLFTKIFYGERLIIINIILTIIEIAVLFLPAILGINMIKSEGRYSFLRKVTIVEIAVFGLSFLFNFYRSYAMGRNYVLNRLASFPTLPILLFYIGLFCFIKNKNDEINEKKPSDIVSENIAKNVVFTILTFGIYSYIWLYRISRKIKSFYNDTTSSAGEILCLLFVPFYSLYWIYTRTKKMNYFAETQSIRISDNSALYLFLSIIGLSIVSIALMQNDLNTIIENLGKTPSVQPSYVETKSTDQFDEIKKYKDLLDSGIITQEEFDARKKELLNL